MIETELGFWKGHTLANQRVPGDDSVGVAKAIVGETNQAVKATDESEVVVGPRLERAMEVGEWFVVETERVVFSSWVEREVAEEFVAVVGLGRRSGIEVEFEMGCDEIRGGDERAP